jgi:hypothetical protein
MPTTNRELFFDAVEYWKDKEYKKWVVRLSARKTNYRNQGKKKEYVDIKLVTAKTAERAILVAKDNCFSLKGKIHCNFSEALTHL